MRHVDRGTYVETVPENGRDLELLEKLYPHLMPFGSVCVAKRVEPVRPSFEGWYRYGSR